MWSRNKFYAVSIYSMHSHCGRHCCASWAEEALPCIVKLMARHEKQSEQTTQVSHSNLTYSIVNTGCLKTRSVLSVFCLAVLYKDQSFSVQMCPQCVLLLCQIKPDTTLCITVYLEWMFLTAPFTLAVIPVHLSPTSYFNSSAAIPAHALDWPHINPDTFDL